MTAHSRMVAIKAADVDRFVSRPDPGRAVVLIFGPDAGLVHERTNLLITASVDDRADPFALAVIEGDALADQPERLVEEAHTVPLFSGRRAVWVKGGGRNFVAAVERVLASPPGPDCRIVIQAGDLKRNAPLRVACERSPKAAALPCYADSGRDIDRLIDEEMRGAGLSIAPDARALLASLIGGDRSASRSEIRKLILFAHGAAAVGVDDVMAVISDATTPALDIVVDSAFAGRLPDVETNFAKARESGITAGTMASAVSRQASALHRLRLDVEAGTSVRDAVEGMIPPVHFSRKDLVRSGLSLWNARRLERIIVRLGETLLDVRQNNKLAYPIVQRALISIATSARRTD